MIDSFQPLFLAMATFVIGHFVLASLPVRQVLIDKIGNNGFRGLFSVFALVTLIWAVRCYVAAPYEELWVQTEALQSIPAAIMPIACIFAIAGVSTRTVTSVGGETMSPEDARPRGILTVTRHPLMWGFSLWALAHLAPNGDMASLIFFGVLPSWLWPVWRISTTVGNGHGQRLGARCADDIGDSLPRLYPRANADRLEGYRVARLAMGIALYALLLIAHEWAIGVSPMPGG